MTAKSKELVGSVEDVQGLDKRKARKDNSRERVLCCPQR